MRIGITIGDASGVGPEVLLRAHEEGGVRDYAINTKRFIGDENGNVTANEQGVESTLMPWLPGPHRVDRGHVRCR